MDVDAYRAYSCSMSAHPSAVGDLLRHWRQRRHLSQLDLAVEVEVSTRHLSFMETGRAVPSRQMLLRVAERLEVPLRERNKLLLAAGYAPMFSEHGLEADAMSTVREAIQRVLSAHEPYPALAVDGHWHLLDANRAVAPLMAGAAPWLLASKINVLRLSLHPEGIASQIENLGEWRAHVLHRLQRQCEQTGDPFLATLYDELAGYPVPVEATTADHAAGAIAVPLRLRTPAGVLSFLSATMVFGTPRDVTLSEIAIETFLPADALTAAALAAV